MKKIFTVIVSLFAVMTLGFNLSISYQKDSSSVDISYLLNSAQAGGECTQTMRYCNGSFGMNWACVDDASSTWCSLYYCEDCAVL